MLRTYALDVLMCLNAQGHTVCVSVSLSVGVCVCACVYMLMPMWSYFYPAIRGHLRSDMNDITAQGGALPTAGP